MSAFAEKLNLETGEWKLVHAVDLDDADRKYPYRCASCHAPAILAICSDKDNYFLSKAHTVDCPVAKGHKLIRINTRSEIDLDAILDYEDHNPVPRGCPPPEEGMEDFEPNPDDKDDPDVDLRLDPDATHSIRSVSGMYRELVEKCGSDYIDSFTSKEVDSIFLRGDTIDKFRENWGAMMKLVVTRRCSPPKELKRDGYVILRDAYSIRDENAIYFMGPRQGKFAKRVPVK